MNLTKKSGLPEFGGDIVKVCVQFWNFICRNATKSFLLLKTFKDSFEIKWNNLINLISYRPGSKILAWRGFHWIWARLYKLEVKANLDEDDEDEEDEDVYLGNRVSLAGNNFEEGKSKSRSKERLGLTSLYKYVIHKYSVWLMAKTLLFALY